MRANPVLRLRYAVLLDTACILLVYVATVWMRFEAKPALGPYLVQNWPLLWTSLVVRIPVYSAFGLYHRLWRYASMQEMLSILAAGTVATAIIWVINFWVLGFLGVPHCTSRALVVMGWLLNLFALGGTRFALRMLQETASRRKREAAPMVQGDQRRVLVAGAGDAGAALVREMLQNPSLGLVPVGFVDDHPGKTGMHIHGVPVVGALSDLAEVVAARDVDEVLIAMPSASGAVVRNIKEACRGARVRFRTVPSLNEMLDGKVSVTQLREVQIEDLLRRDAVVTDQAAVRSSVRGKCVLVTGAGGSIGSELCRQLAHSQVGRLVLLGHGEFSIFTIERELRRTHPQLPLEPVIADIRDGERIARVIARCKPATIYHAAAHKHVPLMETNVEEAFTNNVLGTRCVLRAAEQHGVERFVMISTDKAVNPTSVMGATKRIAELLVQESAHRTGKPYVAVRFGNVLGSRGSVLPIFQEQIARGGPVTITHPEMRRYFMTIPEAVQLVLQAAVLGNGGEVFMLDMGEPVRLVDMVNDLIELSGLTPGEDVEIVFTGMRPGEKLYEELALNSEHYGPTLHDKIFVCRNGAHPLVSGAQLEHRIEEMADLGRQMRPAELLAAVRMVVPEYDPRSEAAAVAATR